MKGIIAILFILFFGCLGTACPDVKETVCGTDGNTYDNLCLAQKAGAEIDYAGPCRAEPGCLDSDEGKDLFTSGQTTGEGLAKTDKCLDQTKVLEHFCKSGAIYAEEIPCPQGRICENGACVLIPCNDSDDGIDADEKGTTILGAMQETDSCAGNASVTEFYCEDEGIKSINVDCTPTQYCSDGACVNYECKDTDGTNDSAKGTTSYINDSYNDSCKDSKTVEEYYCEGREIKSMGMTCEEGYICEEGACIEAPICFDPDNGRDQFMRTVAVSEGRDYEDECAGEGAVLEYYCSGSTLLSEEIACSEDHVCSNGACIPVECRKEESIFLEQDERYKMAEYSSSDTLRIYENEIVEIMDSMMLELVKVNESGAVFALYRDYGKYLEEDDICTESIAGGDSINGMCGKDTDEIELDSFNASADYADIVVRKFYVVEYYSGTGNETAYYGYACQDEGGKAYQEFTAYFYPRIDVLSPGLDLESKEFMFFGTEAKIKDLDPGREIFIFEIDGQEYKLRNEVDFEFNGMRYATDLDFDRERLKSIELKEA